MKMNGVIERKLALLDDQVVRLEEYIRDVDRETFEADWAMRSACERALQVATEIMIDVAERIIALRGAGPVAGPAEAMHRLVDLGVVSSAELYESIVRFRNLIVHEYEKIDPALLFEIVSTRLGDFRAFRDEIDRAGE